MALFGKKKDGRSKPKDPKVKEKPTEDTPRSRPFAAHVTRTRPSEIDGTVLKGEIRTGGFKDLFTYSDLKEFVKQVAGGGDFIASVRDQDEGVIIDTYKFTLAGEPKVDGVVVEKRSKDGKKPKDEESVVERNRREMEEMKSEAEKKKLAKALERDLGEDEDDELPEEPRVLVHEPGPSAETTALREEIAQMKAAMKEQLAEQARRFEEREEKRRAEEEKRRTEERHQREIEDLRREMREMASKKSDDGGFKLMAEMLKDSRESSSKFFDVMLQKSDQTMKMMITQLEKASEIKADQAENALDLMKQAWITATAATAGKLTADGEEEEEKSPIGVLASVADRVVDLIGARMASGETTPEDLAAMNEVQKQQIVDDAIAKVRAEQAALPEPAEMPNVEVSPAHSSSQAAAEAQKKRVARGKALRAQVDRGIVAAIKDISEKGLDGDSPQWYKEAEKLPGAIQAELMATKGDIEKILTVLAKYGTRKLVSKLAEVVKQKQAEQEGDVEPVEVETEPETAPSTPNPEPPAPTPATTPSKKPKQKKVPAVNPETKPVTKPETKTKKDEKPKSPAKETKETRGAKQKSKGN